MRSSVTTGGYAGRSLTQCTFSVELAVDGGGAGAGRRPRGGDDHALLAAVVLDLVVAVAALLDAGERDLVPGLEVRVDPDVPRLDLADVAEDPGHVLAPDPGGEAVATVVGESDGLVVGVERDDHPDRA